jgi:hypothetical protein
MPSLIDDYFLSVWEDALIYLVLNVILALHDIGAHCTSVSYTRIDYCAITCHIYKGLGLLYINK